MYHRHSALSKLGQERRKRRMQAEEPVEVDGFVRSCGASFRSAEAKGRTSAVISVFAVRRYNAEAIRAASQEDHYEQISRFCLLT